MVVRYGQNDSNELLKHLIKGVSSTYCKSNVCKRYFKSLFKLQCQSSNSTLPADPLCSLTNIVVAVRKPSNQTS